MALQTLQGKILSKSMVAKDTYSLRVVTEGIESFDFAAGQFATITVGPDLKRSYSIASMPGRSYLDLIADTVRGGPGSQFFLNAKEGDTFEYMFPLGVFVYKDGEKPAYFFATGTGIVPFMSMVEYALTVQKTQRQIVFYGGFRFLEEVFGKGMLELLDIQYENFRFKLNLTQPPQDWQGPVGRISQYIDTLESTDIDAYICGSNQMITDIKTRLVAKGVPESQVYHEMFY